MAEVTTFQWITAGVALWGAGLSSYLGWRQVRRDRRVVHVRLSWGYMGSPVGDAQGILSVDVANAGHRPVEVRQMFFLLPGERQFVFPQMQTSKALPFKLEEGHSVSSYVPALDFAHALMRAEVGRRIPVRAACRDGLGELYASEPTEIDLAALAELAK